MPEIRFEIIWPDGAQATCYSPSTVVRRYFEAGTSYGVAEFVERSRAALLLASDRVAAKYGMPCSRALGQLAEIERIAAHHEATPEARVTVVRFQD